MILWQSFLRNFVWKIWTVSMKYREFKKKVNFEWELTSRDSSRFRFYTPFSLFSGSARGGETSRFQFLFLRDNPLKIFVVWQYPSKVKHAETRNSYSSRTSEIYPLGRLVVCTTHAHYQTIQKQTESPTSHYNTRHFARRNYQ